MTREGYRDGRGARSGPPPYAEPPVHPASATEPFRQLTPPQGTPHDPPQGPPHGPPHGPPQESPHDPRQGTPHDEVSYLASSGPPAPEPFAEPPADPFAAPSPEPFADPFAGQGERPWVPGPLRAPGEPAAPPMPMSAPVPVDQEMPPPERLAAPPQPPGSYEQAGRDVFGAPGGWGAVGAGIVGEDEAQPPPLPRAKRPLGKRLLSGVVGLALLAGALVARAYVPDEYEQRYAPMLEVGKVGQEVATKRFSFKVNGVYSARVIGWEGSITGDRDKAATDGVFVIIEAQATTAKEPQRLRAANLVTADETRFEPIDKALLAELMEEQQMRPGYWKPGAYVFEVPATTDLTGAKLQVSDDRLQPSNFAAGASVIVPGYGVEIDLGLDAAKANRLLKQPEAGRLLPKATS